MLLRKNILTRQVGIIRIKLLNAGIKHAQPADQLIDKGEARKTRRTVENRWEVVNL